MYGETRRPLGSRPQTEGLSPHVRGNLSLNVLWVSVVRSIPACTGKPPACASAAVMVEVYPRMYGETSRVSLSVLAILGLSPHVRGNRPRKNR